MNISKVIAISLISMSSFVSYAGTTAIASEAKVEKKEVSSSNPSESQEKIKKQLSLIEEKIKEALSKSPKDKELLAKYAAILLAQNKTSEAIPAYQNAIMADPSNAKLFASLSIVYLHHANYKMAKVMAEEALRLKPKMTQANKINAYIDQKVKVLELAKQAKVVSGVAPKDATHGFNKEKQVIKNTDEKK